MSESHYNVLCFLRSFETARDAAQQINHSQAVQALDQLLYRLSTDAASLKVKVAARLVPRLKPDATFEDLREFSNTYLGQNQPGVTLDFLGLSTGRSGGLQELKVRIPIPNDYPAEAQLRDALPKEGDQIRIDVNGDDMARCRLHTEALGATMARLDRNNSLFADTSHEYVSHSEEVTEAFAYLLNALPSDHFASNETNVRWLLTNEKASYDPLTSEEYADFKTLVNLRHELLRCCGFSRFAMPLRKVPVAAGTPVYSLLTSEAYKLLGADPETKRVILQDQEQKLKVVEPERFRYEYVEGQPDQQ